MSHAAIVCREYGLPAVVGTGHATKIIKSGMKVRVDGSTGSIAIVR
jgi:pyruvate,water dikinase